MCQCKLFKQAKRDYCDPGKHQSVKAGFVCLMCNSEKKKYSLHGNDGDYAGFSFECANCHCYIRYLKNDGITLVKDEFYFDDFCVIQDENEIIIDHEELESIVIPRFEFQNKEHFLNKIKTYMVLS